jgi:lipopolysaccharide export system protein LptA
VTSEFIEIIPQYHFNLPALTNDAPEDTAVNNVVNRITRKSMMWLLLSTLLLLFVSHAQDDTQAADSEDVNLLERIITIIYDGGNRASPDLRFGPYSYTHPEDEGLVATVSNLTIYGSQASLSAPDGTMIADAEGQREARFEEGVRVVRGRLDAGGRTLEYSEATGLGTLAPDINILVEPSPTSNNQDDVTITADSVTFDVDTDVSTSRGDVLLINGSQQAEAQELVYEEARDLAKLSSGEEQVRAVRQSEDGELVIVADELRSLTGNDSLLAIGNVIIVDGPIRSMGDVVYFDDATDRAEILGNPATSEELGDDGEILFEISGARIEQRIDLDVVNLLDDTVPAEFNEEDFLLTSELSE